MDKLGRAYDLLVETQDGKTIEIQLPLTIEFDINRNVFSSANTATIRIYNLSENHRKQLRYNLSDYARIRSILLKAGYGKNLALVFSGTIRQAWSVREGANFITTIESYDAGFAYSNAVSSVNFPANTPLRVVLENLIDSLPGVAFGAIGNFPGQNSRGSSYSGSTINILAELTGGNFFIDNGKANCLNNDEYVGDRVPVINASTGLLNTPYLEETFLSFDMIFEPSISLGQTVLLESMTDKNYNGLMKVTAVKHRGTISEAVCGEAITTLRLQYGIKMKKVS